MPSLASTSSEKTSLTRPLHACDMVLSKWEIAQETGVMDSDPDDDSDALEGEELAEALARMRGGGEKKAADEEKIMAPSSLPEQLERRPMCPGPLERAMMTTGVFDDDTEGTSAEARAKLDELEVWKRAMLADGWTAPPGEVKVNWDNPLPSRPNWTDVREWRERKRAEAVPEIMETEGKDGTAGEKVRRVDSHNFDTVEGTLPEPKRRKIVLRISKKDKTAVPKFGVEPEPVRKAEAVKLDERPKIILKLHNPRAKAAKKHPHPLEEEAIGEPVLQQLCEKSDLPVPTSGGRSTRTAVMGRAKMNEKREAYLAKKRGG
ncbi:hypothetical protein CERZMDRAFT_88594 [Cercospora zeae-maydis SCOH1-5]|uniref:Uncharacterized protein n=1 Tax=Cercospora zeae-maydis SCOH1-5 TaxID=717836 RepID=A0A6A6F4C8_9PEZI|nr:hypothetical protein CERZMDRAFT_88594 [Cercospora zeae-maydis SCOH1-5]